jgi:Na+/proline symporter
MVILGLHVIDWLVLVAYLVGMIYIGKWASNKIKNTTDFYQGGRSFGKILFTFLNFGNITNADQATGVSREIYRQGLSGCGFRILFFFSPLFIGLPRFCSGGRAIWHRAISICTAFKVRFLPVCLRSISCWSPFTAVRWDSC